MSLSKTKQVVVPKAENSKPPVKEENLEHLLAQMESARSRSSKALQYLENRNLQEVTEVGYNPGNLYQGLRQCIVFGLRNQDGELGGFYGRCINEKYGKHFYTKNRSGFYPGWPEATAKRVILCESVIDAASVSFYTEDETVLALYGTNGLGEEHLAALERISSLEEIVLFFDGDDAGRAAVDKWSTVLHYRYPS